MKEIELTPATDPNTKVDIKSSTTFLQRDYPDDDEDDALSDDDDSGRADPRGIPRVETGKASSDLQCLRSWSDTAASQDLNDFDKKSMSYDRQVKPFTTSRFGAH